MSTSSSYTTVGEVSGISPFGATLVDDPNAAAARGTLDTPGRTSAETIAGDWIFGGLVTHQAVVTHEAHVRFKSGVPWIDGMAYPSIQAAIDAVATRADFETLAVHRVILFDDATVTSPLTSALGMLTLEGANEGVRIRNTTTDSDVIRLNHGGSAAVAGMQLLNVTLLGTGTGSRAIYGNLLQHFLFEQINTINHPGPTLYLESTNTVVFSGCAFGRIVQLLAQPSTAVVAVTDIAGISNVYEQPRVREAEVGMDFIDARSPEIIGARIESNNRGTAQTGIRFTSVATGNRQRRARLVAPYFENNPAFSIDAGHGVYVEIDGGRGGGVVIAGARKDVIRLDGGGEISGFQGNNVTHLTSAKGRILVTGCDGVSGKASEVEFRDVMPPLRANRRNQATRSWCDSDPSWLALGTTPPTLAYDTTQGFLGTKSKKATFPAGGSGFSFSRASLENTLIPTGAGEGYYSALAFKCSASGVPLEFRHVGVSTGTIVNVMSDTEWQVVIFSTNVLNTAGNHRVTIACATDPGTALDVWVGAMAASVDADIAFSNTEYPSLTTPGETQHARVTAADLRTPAVATASLPAAGAAQDGRVVIEDAGPGDRNVVIYAGGQRFRIDGGAAF